MLKIAHVQLLPLLSGVQRVSLNEIEFLKDRFEFHVICQTHGPLSERVEELSLGVHYVESLQRAVSIRKDLTSLWRLFRLFRRQKFDIVHTHSSKTGFLGRVAARLAGCRSIIHTVHGFSFPAAKSKLAWMIYFVMEWIAKFCTHRLIVMNEADQQFALDKLGYKPERVMFQANGIDLEKFQPAPDGNPIADGDDLKVVMVGRMWEQKDPKTLVDAAVEVLQSGAKFQFDFIGDGEYFDSLVALVEERGLSQKIRFLGWQDNIPSLLPEYHLFVLPSKWEGMPLAILEAFACGLPVIATNIPGNRDLVDSGSDGFLFEIGDREALAGHLLSYRNDLELLVQHGKAASEKAVTRYCIKSRHEAMADLYVRLVGN